MLGKLSQLAEKLQIDRPLTYALVARCWQALAGPLTMVFLIRSLTLGEQGVYYSLSAIMSIQFFFELGLLNVIISQVGHYRSAYLQAATEHDKLIASVRLFSLISAAQRFFWAAGLLFWCSANLLGWWTLKNKSTTIDWGAPLLCLSVFAAGTVILSPKMAVIEGSGFRESVYRTRLLQMLSGAIVVWVSLLAGLKVWALVASAAVQMAFVFYLTRIVHRDLFQPNVDDRGAVVAQTAAMDVKWSWLTQVFPLQWRVALSSMIYHAATQFFTVIVFYFHNDQEAGRLGMTLAATGAIQNLALAWINTKFSLVSGLHGAGLREQAGTLWRRSAVISTGLLVFAMSAALLVVSLLPWAGRGWESRFIEPWQMAVLGLGCLANHWVALQSFYVMSRQARPLLPAALCGFTTTGICVLLGGWYYSTSGIVVGYAAATTLVTLPLHSWAYWRYRNRSESHA